jgi:hypothetical protein
VVDDKDKSDLVPRSARQPIKDWPATERPREKLLQLGPERLSDGELLAVLLSVPGVLNNMSDQEKGIGAASEEGALIAISPRFASKHQRIQQQDI